VRVRVERTGKVVGQRAQNHWSRFFLGLSVTTSAEGKRRQEAPVTQLDWIYFNNPAANIKKGFCSKKPTGKRKKNFSQEVSKNGGRSELSSTGGEIPFAAPKPHGKSAIQTSKSDEGQAQEGPGRNNFLETPRGKGKNRTLASN